LPLPPSMTFCICRSNEKFNSISNKDSSISIVISCELDNWDSILGRCKNFSLCSVDHSLLFMGSKRFFPQSIATETWPLHFIGIWYLEIYLHNPIPLQGVVLNQAWGILSLSLLGMSSAIFVLYGKFPLKELMSWDFSFHIYCIA
jgi:hypothetical protein